MTAQEQATLVPYHSTLHDVNNRQVIRKYEYIDK
jgi:hypothetical protein